MTKRTKSTTSVKLLKVVLLIVKIAAVFVLLYGLMIIVYLASAYGMFLLIGGDNNQYNPGGSFLFLLLNWIPALVIFVLILKLFIWVLGNQSH